jgi:hypothetical protein
MLFEYNFIKNFCFLLNWYNFINVNIDLIDLFLIAKEIFKYLNETNILFDNILKSFVEIF